MSIVSITIFAPYPCQHLYSQMFPSLLTLYFHELSCPFDHSLSLLHQEIVLEISLLSHPFPAGLSPSACEHVVILLLLKWVKFLLTCSLELIPSPCSLCNPLLPHLLPSLVLLASTTPQKNSCCWGRKTCRCCKVQGLVLNPHLTPTDLQEASRNQTSVFFLLHQFLLFTLSCEFFHICQTLTDAVFCLDSRALAFLSLLTPLSSHPGPCL